MFTPPSDEAIIGALQHAVDDDGKVELLDDLRASSTSRRFTTRPCGPVWCVTSVMPSIFCAKLRTSSMDFATFTPPPLPRPPAWICAFTTQTLPPSFCATATASSADNAGSPRGVTTPYLRKICLPWYSWMFMEAVGAGR
jgi:hypothetical protein